MATHDQVPLPDSVELDARWASWSRGVGVPAHDDILHDSSAAGNDFRSYLANLEQEIRGREAAMDCGQHPAAFVSAPGALKSSPKPTFVAHAFAEAEDDAR